MAIIGNDSVKVRIHSNMLYSSIHKFNHTKHTDTQKTHTHTHRRVQRVL